MNLKIMRLEKKKTKGGFLVEFLKGNELDPSKRKFAQIYVVDILPGSISGNHYHKKKSEWISIFNGKVKVVLEDVKTKEKKEIIIDSSRNFLTRVYIGPEISHAFKNMSNSNIILVSYTDKIYDPESPDTYDYKVL